MLGTYLSTKKARWLPDRHFYPAHPQKYFQTFPYHVKVLSFMAVKMHLYRVVYIRP